MSKFQSKTEAKLIVIFMLFDEETKRAEIRSETIDSNQKEYQLTDLKKAKLLKLFESVKLYLQTQNRDLLLKTYNTKNFLNSELFEWYKTMINADKKPSVKIYIQQIVQNNHEYMKLKSTPYHESEYTFVNASL